MSTPTIQTYPFDLTGNLASNLITGEQQILTAGSSPNFHIVVPKLAPYFKNSLVVKFQAVNGPVQTLVEGKDYYCTHLFHDASLACASPIFGSVSFLDWTLQGVVWLQYQTLGGIWTLDDAAIAQILADRLHNPRITTWEQVTNQPVTFPVIDHEWNLTDLVGMSDVVTAIQGVEEMLRQTGQTGLADHIANHNNPHQVTAAQVGLGNVPNFAKATTADAQAGTRDDLFMTPAMTAAAISVLPSSGLAAHIADHTNPHQVTAAQVGLGNVKNYGVASSADAAAGTRDDVYMTPLKVAAQLANGFGQDLANHENDYTNPHRVTAHQAGTYTSQEIDAMFAGKLGTGGVAYDSARFGGQLPADFTASVLAGKAATAGTADNSNALGGQSLTQLLATIAASTVNNANNFGGQSPTAYAASVLSGTAANSTLFSGLTLAQVENDIITQVGQVGARQNTYGPYTGEAGANYWQELGQLVMPSAGDAATKWMDTSWIVAGCSSNGQVLDSAYMVHFSTRGAAPNQVMMEVRCLTANDTGVQFGWTVENIDFGSGPVPTLRVWMKTGPNLGLTTATALVRNGAVFLANPNRVAAAPASIAYATTVSYVTSDQLTATLDAITAQYTALAASIAAN
jgi:hypothetical protein